MHRVWLVPALLSSAACTRPDAKNAPDTAAPSSTASAATGSHPITRPPDATAEFGVLTDRSKEQLANIIAPNTLGALLEPRHCGPKSACDAVRALVADRERVDVSLAAADDWGVPDQASLEFVAKSLSPQDRATVHKRQRVVVVRAHGKATPEHLVARAGFALTAAIAERVKGLVYDETVRRIETADQFASHSITTPLGDSVFREDRVVIQLYEQENGTSRLLSLGMRRFGAPDLEIRGAQPGTSRSLGNAMNAVAARLTSGAGEAPLIVAPGKSATIDLVVPPHQEGDPDNTVVRIVPPGGANVKGYDDLAMSLFGTAEHLVEQTDDAALVAAKDRAARAFPRIVSQWNKWPQPRPSLLVKLPFSIAGDAGIEWMWVDVKSVDDATITGALANSPAYITDLKGGSTVRGRRKDVYDYLLKLPDGGTEGGETIRILEGRK